MNRMVSDKSYERVLLDVYAQILNRWWRGGLVWEIMDKETPRR